MTEWNPEIKSLAAITRCPECGCAEVREYRKWSQHTNGKWNERTTFACHAAYEFSPNFDCVGVYTVCQRSDTHKKRETLNKQFKSDVFALAEKKGIHKDDVVSLKRNLEYWG